MVAASGYKGEKIVLQYPNNNLAFGEEVAQAIANYLGQVGINIELQGMEYSAFFPLWANRKLNGLHLFAYGPSIMDADLIIGSLYDSTGRVYWTDPKVHQLAQQQRGERDKDKRRALIAEILKLSKETCPTPRFMTKSTPMEFRIASNGSHGLTNVCSSRTPRS